MNAILQLTRLLVIGFSVILAGLVLWFPPTHMRSSPDPFSREAAEAQIPQSGHMQKKGDVFVASTKIVVDRKKEAFEICLIVFIASVILRGMRGRSSAH